MADWWTSPDKLDDYRADSAQVSELAVVDQPVKLMDHVVIQAYTQVSAHVSIGQQSQIASHCVIPQGVIIGNHVRIQPYALLATGVILEDDVYIGPSVVFAPIKRMRGQLQNLSRVSPTILREGASVGPHCTVGTGVSVGKHAFIEAGSIVESPIPDFAIAGGNPVQILAWRCQCGAVLNFTSSYSIRCSYCGLGYSKISETKVSANLPGAKSIRSIEQD
ncbi:MAG: acyltransferase [Vampirovibrionales bacterium]|nr:acyltransferase [Vampirovibrionales bacterium]